MREHISDVAPTEDEVYIAILDWQRRAIPEALRTFPNNEEFNLACKRVFLDTIKQVISYAKARSESFVVINTVLRDRDICLSSVTDRILEELYNTSSNPYIFQRMNNEHGRKQTDNTQKARTSPQWNLCTNLPHGICATAPLPDISPDVHGLQSDLMLRRAASTGNITTLIDLLEAGINPNASEYRHIIVEGYHYTCSTPTPLICAIRGNHPLAVTLLLDHGAEMETPIYRGHTPLMVAARRGYPNMVRQLLKEGALVEARDWAGETAIFKAAASRNIEVVELLLEAGANVGVKDYKGKNILEARVPPVHADLYQRLHLLVWLRK